LDGMVRRLHSIDVLSMLCRSLRIVRSRHVH
jgi:hypothetical protein